MAVFPSIELSKKTTKEAIRASDRSSLDNGAVTSRPKYTMPRYRFKLVFEAITTEEYDELEEFFLANSGTFFTFTYPRDGLTYTLTFEQDSIKPDYINNARINTEITAISK